MTTNMRILPLMTAKIQTSPVMTANIQNSPAMTATMRKKTFLLSRKPLVGTYTKCRE